MLGNIKVPTEFPVRTAQTQLFLEGISKICFRLEKFQFLPKFPRILEQPGIFPNGSRFLKFLREKIVFGQSGHGIQ